MKLEQQVCSLELAQKLKALGVKQESLFWWIAPQVSDWHVTFHPDRHKTDTLVQYAGFSAFTVAELGEMLPPYLERGGSCIALRTSKCDDGSGWTVSYYNFEIVVGETEANARAEMMVYLIEQKLIGLSNPGASSRP